MSLALSAALPAPSAVPALTWQAELADEQRAALGSFRPSRRCPTRRPPGSAPRHVVELCQQLRIRPLREGAGEQTPGAAPHLTGPWPLCMAGGDHRQGAGEALGAEDSGLLGKNFAQDPKPRP